jgi:hypothetical protein
LVITFSGTPSATFWPSRIKERGDRRQEQSAPINPHSQIFGDLLKTAFVPSLSINSNLEDFAPQTAGAGVSMEPANKNSAGHRPKRHLVFIKPFLS